MYADDTSVTCSAHDIDDLSNDLKAEVENITEWFKTEYMEVGYKGQTNHILRPIDVNIVGESSNRVKNSNTLELLWTKT